ncbi:hypothetical protein EJA03_10955 [Vibrio pectenicida]|uniref:Uncharacterized protein n=1 Tax=Vibrio pectenicida TaxID=62763 RepID=A0A3R9F6L0_9VIBR|nr:hypothetical protein EJA03_10955 [Vibrio pectenicida]
MQRCELNRPEVQSLFISWLKAFTNHLKVSQFDALIIWKRESCLNEKLD